MDSPSSLDLTDQEFLTAFHRGELVRYAFPHTAHLRLVWLLVRQLGTVRAIALATAGIRALAEKVGRGGVYHDTMTRAWIYLIAAATAHDPATLTFDAFLGRHPELLDKAYLLQYYSPSRLSSPEARDHWVRPDLQSIPGAPASTGAGEPPGNFPTALPFARFMDVLDRLPLPVAVMAAHDSFHVHGATVSSVATVARDPAILVASVRPDSRLLPIIRASGGFAVSYLGAGQKSVAIQFSDRARGDGVAQFHGIPHTLGPFGAPIISVAAAWFECRVRHEFAAGGHQVICGTVVAAGTNDVPPLQRMGKNQL